MQCYGRFLHKENGAVSFDWSGCTKEEDFFGTEVSVRISAEPVLHEISYDYITYGIDGTKET